MLPRVHRTTIVVLVFFAAYAIARYHLFKGEPWRRFPLWTLNKVAAMASVTLFAIALLKGVRRRSPESVAEAGVLGRIGFSFAAGHIVASVALFNAVEYPRFFGPGGGLTLWTSLAIAAGVGAFLLLRQLAPGNTEGGAAGARRRLVRLALLATAVHTVGLGWFVWIDVATWPGRMLPLTLIGCAIAAGAWIASYALGREPRA